METAQKGWQRAHTQLVNACLDTLALYSRGTASYFWINSTRAIYDATRGAFRSTTQEKGPGDILGCLAPNGRLVEIECKAGKSGLNKHQREHRAKVEPGGALCLTVRRPEDLEPVLELIKGNHA